MSSFFHLIRISVDFCKVWDRAEEFVPERFDLEGPVPNETNTDFRFVIEFLVVLSRCHSKGVSYNYLVRSQLFVIPQS